MLFKTDHDGKNNVSVCTCLAFTLHMSCVRFFLLSLRSGVFFLRVQLMFSNLHVTRTAGCREA